MRTVKTRRAADMTADQIRACCLRCTIKLPKRNGAVRVDSGDWFAYVARSEPTRRYWRMAKDDLRLRELGQKIQTDDFHGPHGRVRIGGKMFSLFPVSGMLVRDDFADWAERHFDECWDKIRNRERLPERDGTGKDAGDDPIARTFAEARRLALKLPDVTDLLEPGTWNTVYDMRKTLTGYSAAIEAARRRGLFYVGTKMLADQLAGTLAYRERHYADAVEFFHRLAAGALKAARFVQDRAMAETTSSVTSTSNDGNGNENENGKSR